MANEAVPIYGTGEKLRIFTCAANPTVSFGTLMLLSGDNTASFSLAGSGAQFAGIAFSDKSTNETVLTLDMGGQWDLTASGAIPAGHKVVMAGGNKVMDIDLTTAAVAASGAQVVGTVFEAASDNEQVRVDLDRR